MSDQSDKPAVTKSDQQWQQELSPEEYYVTRHCGTEPPFSGQYYKFDGVGTYHCICCNAPLFHSSTKFESGTGWPSYWQPVSDNAVRRLEDRTHGMVRVEIRCANCDAHLGHQFSDGPAPTGQRYCINSVSLNFSEDPS